MTAPCASTRVSRTLFVGCWGNSSIVSDWQVSFLSETTVLYTNILLVQAGVRNVQQNPTFLICTGLKDSGADTVWTCSAVLVQSLQLPLLMPCVKQAWGADDGSTSISWFGWLNNEEATWSMTEAKDEPSEEWLEAVCRQACHNKSIDCMTNLNKFNHFHFHDFLFLTKTGW